MRHLPVILSRLSPVKRVSMKSYRAAVCTELTGPDSIEIKHFDITAPQPDQIAINVRAAGLNFPDLLMTYGKYQFRPEPPFVAGLEIAGEIAALGKGVTGFTIGQRVMAGLKGGGLAEYAIVDADAVRPLPDCFSFSQGACWQTGAVTAWHALHDKAALQTGESILVLGASGGVGMAAVMLAKYIGAAVIATASSAAKRDAVLAAGADYVLDPAAPDLAKQVKALTGGKGVDAVFDPVGGDLAITATRAIGWGGRYLIIGFASGDIPKFPANHALIKGYSLIGLRAGEANRRDPILAQSTAKALQKLAESGVMQPHISHHFPLEEAGSALKVLEERRAIGRVVLNI